MILILSKLLEKFNIKSNKFYIIDLTVIGKLQKKYLDKHNILNVEIVDASTFGKNINENNLFLLSIYALSEISSELRDNYYKYLFPKITNGFILWNTIVIDLINYKKIDKEEPITGNFNKIIYI